MGPIDPNTPTPDVTEFELPDGRKVYLVPRDQMLRRTVRNTLLGSLKAPSLPTVSLPIDWTKNNELDFPYLGNDKYGNCFYVSAIHQDQSMTGCVGPSQSQYDTAEVVKYYLALAGRDRGLYEEQVVGEWTKGLCGRKDAAIFDHCDIDPTNVQLMQAALYFFGGVQFQFSVPSRWMSGFKTGAVWDAPAIPNPLAGHAVHFSGVDAQGRYKVQTWGSYCWLTQAGLRACRPDAFVVASLRWFNPQGYAPNGRHYTELAVLWEQLGGSKWPASPFPAPGPTPPPPGPTPPTPGGEQVITIPNVAMGIYTAEVTIKFRVDDAVPMPQS